jgi:hypothetical protein
VQDSSTGEGPPGEGEEGDEGETDDDDDDDDDEYVAVRACEGEGTGDASKASLFPVRFIWLGAHVGGG